MPAGSPAAVGQSVQPAVLVPLEDLVAGLARNIELAAQGRHLLAVKQSGYEPEAFIHLVTLVPGHFALPQSPEVLPLFQEAHKGLQRCEPFFSTFWLDTRRSSFG